MLSLIKKYYRVRTSSIAHLLGKSISFVNAVSVGERSFSLSDLTLLKSYYDALRLDTPIEELSTSHYHTSQPDIIEQRIAQQAKRLERLKNQLLDNIEKRLSIERGLDSSIQLLSGSLSIEENKWVELRANHLQSYLDECPKENEILLQAKISGLESELQILRDSI